MTVVSGYIIVDNIFQNLYKTIIFYIFIESPVVSLQVPNNQTLQKKESNEQLSPQPPPRGRHNPFNKSTQSPQRKDIVSFRKSFKDLHNQLGRPILRDRNEWRFGLIKQEINNQEPLITF